MTFTEGIDQQYGEPTVNNKPLISIRHAENKFLHSGSLIMTAQRLYMSSCLVELVQCIGSETETKYSYGLCLFTANLWLTWPKPILDIEEIQVHLIGVITSTLF